MADADYSNEQWLDIPGHEGRYQASSLGRIRSLDRFVKYPTHTSWRRGKVLSPNSREKGHQYVCLGRGPKRYVHRLVALTFIGDPDGLMVRHLNDDPTDNRVENLALGGGTENLLDAVRNGRHAMANRTHCPYGHPYSSGNTYNIPNSGSRVCRTCAKQRSKESYEKVRNPDAIPMSDRAECPYGHPYSAENTYIIPKTGSRTCRKCAHRRRQEHAAREKRQPN